MNRLLTGRAMTVAEEVFGATRGSLLQPGIAFRSGQRPAPCYRLVLLDAAPGANPTVVHDALRDIDQMLCDLAAGQVRELQGQPPEGKIASAQQFAGLEHLLALGRRLFDGDVHQPRLVRGSRPDYLAYLPADGPFPALPWADGTRGRNRGEADIAIQLTAERQAGVNCAAVEIWKLLADLGGPLRVVASFDGFGRPDGRGWLEFHDGVSNMEAGQRAVALEARGNPEWMRGGTYMVFLRLHIHLTTWRALSRTEQEMLVGRDKLTGGALVATERDRSGRLLPISASPPGPDAGQHERSDFIDPPQSTDPLIEASHVHRANQTRSSPSAAGAFRIFRQGYDFLYGIEGETPALGLNFVSFQRDLAIVQHLLHLPGWLGDVNFGGSADPASGNPPSVDFISVLAGGLYAVPPLAKPFPGAHLFAGVTTPR